MTFTLTPNDVAIIETNYIIDYK